MVDDTGQSCTEDPRHFALEPAAQAATRSARVAWVGMYPSHFIGRLHREIEARWSGQVRFLYVEFVAWEARERVYEQREFPRNSAVIARRGARALLRELSRFAPDDVVTAGHNPMLFMVAALWAKLHRCKIYYWSDTNLQDTLGDPWWRQQIKRLLIGGYLRVMIDGFLCAGSQNEAFFAWCRVPADRPRIRMPIPHDPAPFEAAAAARDQVRQALDLGGKFVALYVGRLVPHKKVDHIVRALTLVPVPARSQLLLLIVGDGTERQALQDLAGNLGLESQVRFCGVVSSNGVAEYVSAADALVVASEREPWGLVLNEACSAGVPAIVPAWVGAAADLVQDGVSGYKIADNSPEQIAGALAALAADPERARAMGKRARAIVNEGGWTCEGSLAGWSRALGGSLLPSTSVGARNGL